MGLLSSWAKKTGERIGRQAAKEALNLPETKKLLDDRLDRAVEDSMLRVGSKLSGPVEATGFLCAGIARVVGNSDCTFEQGRAHFHSAYGEIGAPFGHKDHGWTAEDARTIADEYMSSYFEQKEAG